MSALVEPCLACARFVRRGSEVCPFCGAEHVTRPLPARPRARARLALAGGAALLAVACSEPGPAESTSGGEQVESSEADLNSAHAEDGASTQPAADTDSPADTAHADTGHADTGHADTAEEGGETYQEDLRRAREAVDPGQLEPNDNGRMPGDRAEECATCPVPPYGTPADPSLV